MYSTAKELLQNSFLPDVFKSELDLLFEGIDEAINSCMLQYNVNILFEITDNQYDNYYRRARSIRNSDGTYTISIGIDIFNLLGSGIVEYDSEMLSNNYHELNLASHLTSNDEWIYQKIIFIASIYLIIQHEIAHISFNHHCDNTINRKQKEIDADFCAAENLNLIIKKLITQYSCEMPSNVIFVDTFLTFVVQLSCMYSIWKIHTTRNVSNSNYPAMSERITNIAGWFILRDIKQYLCSNVQNIQGNLEKHIKNFWVVFNRFNIILGEDWEVEGNKAKVILEKIINERI